jgi:glyoxylase-like metal-dependent hydrolase (beta-lactamase superfamily II)/rhodanese-related sulfurtransferase
MMIEQIYTKCLAQGAYYIRSKGEAAIIDPLREVSSYISKAKEDNVTIKYIFETHFHADFVSGHVTLAEKTGAEIVYGPNANPNFKARIAVDEEIFNLGDIQIKVLHTPGHTMESTTYLLLDEKGKEHAIFTGDTLFIGDVGRPDLAQKFGELTMEDLAGYSFDSLRNKIMTLPNDVIVYPAHGAGSACGKNMMKETFDSLGNQKKVNYALRSDMTREEFIKEVTDGLLPPPNYFPLNVKMNKDGYESIDDVLKKGLKPLSANEFEIIANKKEAIVLDVREPQEFAKEHIPNSIFIGLDGGFAPWVGEIIVNTLQPIILIAPEGREEEAVTRLSRVGFDNTQGYLKGGLDAWKLANKKTDKVNSIGAVELAEKDLAKNSKIFDVRKKTEYQAEHVENATNTPLSSLKDHSELFSKEEPFYIHCASGYRSMIAASILKSKGLHNLVDVQGGFNAISKTSIPTTNYVCPSTL